MDTSNHTQMVYDALGRKRSMSDPDMGTWSYTYDAVGNVLSIQDWKAGAPQVMAD